MQSLFRGPKSKGNDMFHMLPNIRHCQIRLRFSICARLTYWQRCLAPYYFSLIIELVHHTRINFGLVLVDVKSFLGQTAIN